MPHSRWPPPASLFVPNADRISATHGPESSSGANTRAIPRASGDNDVIDQDPKPQGKEVQNMKKSAFSIIALGLIASFAEARPHQNIETWKGHGFFFDDHRSPVGQYQLVLVRTRRAETTIQQNVEITFSNGDIRREECRMTESQAGKSWEISCNGRSGHGQCFGDGLCLDYQEDEAGSAFATTIIQDGDRTMRLLRVELKDGRAIRFFREKLIRAPNH